MAESVRARRIRNEGRILAALVAANPGGLTAGDWTSNGADDEVTVTLLDTPAHLAPGIVGRIHKLRIVFPEYFPAVPIAAYLERPVLHPNVHPENGFICLWSKHAPGDTLAEALLQAQRVITCRIRNSHAEHVMQPEGADELPPLLYTPLRVPPEYDQKARPRTGNSPVRRRLSSIER